MHKSILKSEIRLAEHKERLIFDIIHVRQEHQGWNNQDMINYLSGPDCTKQEAGEWLCRYLEQKIAKAGEKYREQIDQWVTEIAEIKRKEQRKK